MEQRKPRKGPHTDDRRYKWEQDWGCSRKKAAFNTERRARQEASKILHLKGDRLHAYKCHHCKLWHLGH